MFTRLSILLAVLLGLFTACAPESEMSEVDPEFDQVAHEEAPDGAEPIPDHKLYYFESKAQVIAYVESTLGITWEWSDNPSNLVVIRKAGSGYRPSSSEAPYDDLFIVVDRDQDAIHHFSRGNAEGTDVYSRQQQYGYTNYRDPNTGSFETPALAPGQYRFKVALHRSQYKALWVYRWDYSRLGLPSQRLAGNDGDYYVGGVNVHKGGDTWNYSVGCLTQHYSYWDEFISNFDMGKWGRIYVVGDWNGSFQEPNSALTYEQFHVETPSGSQVGEPVTFSGPCTGGIYSVRVEVDGYEVCRLSTPNTTWSCTSPLTVPGQNRHVIAYAYGQEGQLKGTAETAISVVDVTGDVQVNVDDEVVIQGVPAHFSGWVNNLSGGTVVVEVDGYEIYSGAVGSNNESFNFTHTFSNFGTGRSLVVKGFSASGALVSSNTGTVDVQADSAVLMTTTVPDPIHVGVPVTFTGLARNIAKVSIEVDGWDAGAINVNTESHYFFTITFTNAGNNRNLVLRGLDAGGNPIPGAELTRSVDILP